MIDRDLARRYWPQLALPACALALLLWGAFAPLGYDSRELPFEFPARGRETRDMPPSVLLTLGVQDVLLLRNRDKVAHAFGPVLVLPGQDFTLPFEQAGHFEFNCSAQASGRMTVHVVEQPAPGWERLRWRARKLVHDLRYLPLVAPG